MLTKNYIQFEHEKYKLKYYIQRKECDNIFKYLASGKEEEIYIPNSLGALNNDIVENEVYVNICGISILDSALLFFNNRLYKIHELYIDDSDVCVSRRKPEDITELRLFKDKNIRRIGVLGVFLYRPIYRCYE